MPRPHVPPQFTPTGVEHFGEAVDAVGADGVPPQFTPTGVEHRYTPPEGGPVITCPLSSRLRALSTLDWGPVNERTGSAPSVHAYGR